jgi:lysine-N-methylase
MTRPGRLLQAQHYETFRCIGADCEDTCCDGWSVTVDRHTYDKYQGCSDPELAVPLRELVTINANAANDDEYATFKLSETHCPFLAQGLCSIQGRLGEDYLSNTCATYPRMMTVAGDVLERTLDLSCPEAARIVLLDPAPLRFEERESNGEAFRIGNVSVPDTPNSKYGDKPYPYFREVRGLAVTLLQERMYPLWQRLLILAYFCDKLNEMAEAGNDQDVPKIIQGYLDAALHRLFDDVLSKLEARPAVQFETTIELIINRISSAFTVRRFLDCYQELLWGLHWTQESTMADLVSRYQEAHSAYYVPLMQQHEHVMERYFINHVYRSAFPFDRLETNRRSGLHHISNSICTQYMLMITYYSIIKTVSIGMAAFHKSAFGLEHMIKIIQSSTKAFQHSTSFPMRAVEHLRGKGMNSALSMAVLIQN